MEQAFRRLIKELKNHPSIKSVEGNYYEIKIVWKSGIRERIIPARYENNFKKDSYLRAVMYRPRFIRTNVQWWDQISTGNKINPHFLYIDEIVDDTSKYANLIEWKWSDYFKAKFYERLLMHNDIIEYITEHGWQGCKYPEHVLRNSMQLMYDEKLSVYKSKRLKNYQITNYHGNERPGVMALKHFMPYGFYGFNDPSFRLTIKSYRDAKRVYKAINNIISHNLVRVKKGRKQFINFNYENILKYMKAKKSNPYYKFRQIGLYRLLIQDFELSGQSFYDVDPIMGELALAAHAEGCPYYFRPTCPFDEYSDDMATFLSAEWHPDNNERYDFTIFDNGFKYDKDTYDTVMELFSEKVDTAIIFVNNKNIDEFCTKYPPDEEYKMRLSKSPDINGKWLIFHF